MFEKLLFSLAGSFDKAGIGYMVIGGQAVLLYGNPRLTRDIDITVALDVDSYDKIEQVCKESSLKILPKEPLKFVSETRVLPCEDMGSKIRVDFIFSYTEYERQATKRAKKVMLNKRPVSFASAEDVIIHKLFANRAIDIEGVRGILIKHKEKIDLVYTRKWLKDFSVISDKENILEIFENLYKEQPKEGFR